MPEVVNEPSQGLLVADGMVLGRVEEHTTYPLALVLDLFLGYWIVICCAER